jgi:acyl dehydratase
MSMINNKKAFMYWDDFVKGQVLSFGSYTITEEEILSFAIQYDPQRFHVSVGEAEKTIFKGLIASGWQTCALMMRMVCDGFMTNSSSVGSPGLENLKWVKPVRPGDTLRVEVEVLESRQLNSKPHLGMVFTRWSCFNQDNDLTTTLEAWNMFGKRPQLTDNDS